MTSREGLFKAAGTIVIVSVISKILGFGREISFAAVLGATYATDAYLVGQTIPVLIFAAVGAALGSTFIPVFSKVRQDEGREAAFRMATTVINATLLLALVFVVVGEVLAEPLIRLVAPGFTGSVRALTVHLSRIMFPVIAFQGLSGIFTGMLQVEGNFTVPAAVGLAFNAVLISAILVLGPTSGVEGVAVATVAAAAAQAFLQMPSLARLGYRWRPALDLGDQGLRRIGALVGPVIVSTAVGQINAVVDRVLASGLPEGSVAALNYANRFAGLAPGVFGSAIVTVMYPTLAGFAAANDWRRFGQSFAEAAKMISIIMVPVAVGMAVLRIPLVRLAFERGAFDAQATEATAWALLFYCVGVSVTTLCGIVNRAFFALQDTTTPMIVGAMSVGVNVVANLLLVGPLQHGGLALGTSLSAAFNVGALMWMLKRRTVTMDPARAVAPGELGNMPACGRALESSGSTRPAPGIGGRAILGSLWRVVLASAIMGIVVHISYSALEARLPSRSVFIQAVRLFGGVSVGVISYAVLISILGVPEARLIFGIIRKILKSAATMVRRHCEGLIRP